MHAHEYWEDMACCEFSNLSVLTILGFDSLHLLLSVSSTVFLSIFNGFGIHVGLASSIINASVFLAGFLAAILSWTALGGRSRGSCGS